MKTVIQQINNSTIKQTLNPNKVFIIIMIMFIVGILDFGFRISLALPKQIVQPWSSQGVLVNDAVGDSVQRNPKIIPDDQGGYLVAWEDARSGYFDIYIQKIDKEGNLRFGQDGIAVCGEARNQLYPNLVGDGRGGAIIVWQDYREGAFDIYAQHVAADGKLLWKRGGIAVCQADYNQFAPEVVTDGAGGAIIAWYDYRGNSDEDLYAQRINAFGEALWAPNGVPVVTGPGTQWYPKLVSDGKRGAVLTWADSRNGNYDIYAQRISEKGEGLWHENGRKVCDAAGNQLQPVLNLYKDLGVVITWEDYRASFPLVFAQFVDLDGGLFWHKDAVRISNSPYPQKNPIISLSDKEVVIAWEDYHEGLPRVYLQQLNQEGKILWGAEGIKASTLGAVQVKPQLAAMGGHKMLLAWEGKTDQNEEFPWRVYAQLIDADGQKLWGEGRQIAESKEGQQLLSLAADPKEGCFAAAWQAEKGKSFDIYAQQMTMAGKEIWGKEGILVNASLGNVAQQNAKIVNDGFDNYFIAWEDARSGYYNIYMQKIAGAGQLLWDKEGLAITSLPFSAANPQLVADGAGGVYVAWEDFRNNNGPHIYAQSVDPKGQVKWPQGGMRLSQDNSLQTKPAISLAGDGALLVAWKDADPRSGSTDIVTQKISLDGDLKWGKAGIVVSAAAQDQDSPQIVGDANEGAIIVWADYRNGRRNPDIYAQRLNEKGQALWAMEGIPVCVAPGPQIEPWVVADNHGGVFIVWADAGGGNYDIYAQRLDAWGKPLWKVDGISVSSAAATQRRPRMVKSNNDEVVVTWEDYRFENWDVFAQKLDAFGTNLWKEDGVPVCQWVDTQYSPNLASDGSGGVIITWEDYRNGRNYDIFSQSIAADGSARWEEGGVLVSETPNGERNPQIAGDKKGGAVIITWDDYRYGGRGIYAQKIVTMSTETTPDL